MSSTVGPIRAVDTSMAIPFLVASHEFHRPARAAFDGDLVLTGHSLAETYSVLTRLPGDARLAPLDAAKLIEASFGKAVTLSSRTTQRLPRILAELRVAGGQVYDALVALAARDAGLTLLTADGRATATYAAVGGPYEWVGLA